MKNYFINCEFLSAAAGLAVLEVIEKEGLQQNSKEVEEVGNLLIYKYLNDICLFVGWNIFFEMSR